MKESNTLKEAKSIERLTDRSKEIPLAAAWNSMFWADVYEKLARYEDAEEQGRLIVLPCKVGDMAYYRKGQYIYGDDVKRVVLDGMDNQVILDANHCYLFSDFGSKVFLSREEAEKALEGMK